MSTLAEIRDRLTTLAVVADGASRQPDRSRTERACHKATRDAYITALNLLTEVEPKETR